MARPSFGHVTPETLGLFTDLYELKMIQGYLEHDHTPEATFSLFFRSLPAERGYMVAAGLEQVVSFVESVTFGDRALSFLRDQGFEETFIGYLDDFSFSGEIRAVPEGTPVFPDEPILEVTAPLPEGQLLETLVINQVGYQTLIATKARRMRDVIERHGDGQTLADFGSRRAHGTDAGMKAARASYLGGFDGTSNVAAGEAFDIPTIGTMAHSWIQSFPSERAAFEAFVDEYGDESILLVDTYDTLEGAKMARSVAADRGVDIRGIRLDSGDLVALSKSVDEAVPELPKYISSGMDEYAIKAFLTSGGQGVGFGPGTALTTSSDAPSLDIVYKLVAVERDGELESTMKLSTGKMTFPGQKQLWRTTEDGVFAGDVIGRGAETQSGTGLLEPVIENGTVTADLPGLDSICDRALEQVRRLPEDCRSIRDPTPYPVEISARLSEEAERVQRHLEADHR